jgi:CBS domain-containing protein
MATVQDMMQEPVLVLAPENTVEQTIAAIRAIPRERQYTYPMVADKKGRLVGLVLMRDLILADAKAKTSSVMMTKIFSLQQGLGVHDALKRIKGMEIPEYPIIARNGKLRGVVRAARLHEIEEARLTATPGRMVGVAEGETVATPFLASVKSRLPWLMINLVTAFAAGLLVGNSRHDRPRRAAGCLPTRPRRSVRQYRRPGAGHHLTHPGRHGRYRLLFRCLVKRNTPRHRARYHHWHPRWGGDLYRRHDAGRQRTGIPSADRLLCHNPFRFCQWVVRRIRSGRAQTVRR